MLVEGVKDYAIFMLDPDGPVTDPLEEEKPGRPFTSSELDGVIVPEMAIGPVLWPPTTRR